jgi:elongation factor 1 alpha-like protein
MRLGTIEVRAKLPDGAGYIAENQIHDALWHYYYDVEKTVGYLITTYVAKPKKEQKVAAGKKATGGFCLLSQMLILVFLNFAELEG